ncbi:hypothetical protein HOY82DRAFT_56939 [Tuber indicum]|nr:hypothetical protein HOY82DRAFT_56939 [Tuber indicum]
MSSSRFPRKFTPPASPTASYYDISDDDENGYSTITNTSTGRSVKLLRYVETRNYWSILSYAIHAFKMFLKLTFFRSVGLCAPNALEN